jgi:phage baseplate assembly protein V
MLGGVLMNTDIKNLFRIGIVTALDEAAQQVRVTFSDLDNTVSPLMQVATWGAHKDDCYWIPDIDEQVFCLFMPTGNAEGYVLFSVRGSSDAPSNGALGQRYVKFGDGSIVGFDRTTGTMTVNCKGAVNITAASGVTVTGNMTINGNIATSGNISASGGIKSSGSIAANSDVSAGGISLKSHTHSGVENGNGLTGVAQ